TSTRAWTTWKPATVWAAPATSRNSPSGWPGPSGRSTPSSAPNCNAGTRPTRNAPGAAARRCAGRLSAGRFRNRAPTKPRTPSLWGRPPAANGARTDTTAGTAAPLAGINPAPQLSTTRPHGPVALQGGQRFPVRRWRPTAPRPADKNDVVRPTGLTPDPIPAGPALRRPTAVGPTQQP